MKTLEYILNATYYGCYLFVQKIDIIPGRDRRFIMEGLGTFWGCSIMLYLFSIMIVIDRLLDIGLAVNETLFLWILLGMLLIIFGVLYYFIDRNQKHITYVRKFMREDKPWKYILIFLLFGIGSMLCFYLSMAVEL